MPPTNHEDRQKKKRYLQQQLAHLLADIERTRRQIEEEHQEKEQRILKIRELRDLPVWQVQTIIQSYTEKAPELKDLVEKLSALTLQLIDGVHKVPKILDVLTVVQPLLRMHGQSKEDIDDDEEFAAFRSHASSLIKR